jgi:hypothetical protein
MRICLFFSLFLTLLACNSPEARFDRLRREFWENFARQDYYNIQLGEERLHLPLPAADGTNVGKRKEKVVELQQWVQLLEKETLEDASRRQLGQISRALNDLSASTQGVLFDPSRCTLVQTLQEYAGRPSIAGLLEKIPEYYEKVEAGWVKPEPRLAEKAIEESKLVLDMLREWEKNAPEDRRIQIEAAQHAIKDFIGLCQSAFL